jgi:hypothetical protein
MIGKALAGLAALTFALASTAAAAGPAGAGAGVGGPMGAIGAISIPQIGNLRGLGGGGRLGGIGTDMNTLEPGLFPTNDPNHYHEITLVGRLSKDGAGLTVDQQVVHMRVDGHTIPMSINGDAMSNSLQLDQGDELGQVLYRLILSRQLEVVGDQKLRAQLADAAAASPTRRIAVDGFVYDRTTPYLVLVSVRDAP